MNTELTEASLTELLLAMRDTPGLMLITPSRLMVSPGNFKAAWRFINPHGSHSRSFYRYLQKRGARK